jgi:hypothetical protein
MEKKMSNAAHTPTPWDMDESGVRINADNGCATTIAFCAGITPGTNWSGTDYATHSHAKANAAFIVRACNVHEQFVDALRKGRVAIDVLMAQLIEVDPSFRPTQSAAWPALVAIKAALEKVEA